MDITFALKSQFFDREAVRRKVSAANRRVLSKGGAFVRRRARSSIRFRKRVSDPGQPPSAHTRSEPNLRTILFAYEPARETVVIGPVKLGNKKGQAPKLLEHGGTSRISRGRRKPVVRTATYRPRPFMGPALAQEQQNFAEQWRGAVR